MEFRIADTFTDSLTKLTAQEQKAVKTTAFDLQLDPSSPGMKFHKLDKARDTRFWSVRVSSDIRLIVHRTDGSLMLCYVDHHDPAYKWAECRKIERHPRTGAAQLVEVRESVEEIKVPKYVEVEQPKPLKPRLFARYSEDELLAYGVPAEWIDDVHAATEDSLLELADHLPREAAEALLQLATGSRPDVPREAAPEADPFEHPDAQRRFRVVSNVAELQRALDFPWEKWTVFLHPAQRELVERNFTGPARIAGSAGTGKTIVALHRAVFLARKHAQASVLLATFSETLASALQTRLGRLAGNEPAVMNRIQVHSLNSIGLKLYEERAGSARIASEHEIRGLIRTASAQGDAHRFSDQFLWSEWQEVVDAWQLKSWDDYRDVSRLGRKTRVGEKQRQLLWKIFAEVQSQLQAGNLVTQSMIFDRVAGDFSRRPAPFDFVVIDEAQDIGIPELKFVSAMGASKPNSLFFTGDLGQRIFQPAFSWKSLGIDIRGRSHTLRINYRTSHQIRQSADRLLPAALSDVDGNTESRTGTVSVFNGLPPTISTFDNSKDESQAVADWLRSLIKDGFQPHEIGIFVRSKAQLVSVSKVS